MKIIREPLVHFLLLGAVFYGLYAWTWGVSSEGSGEVIRVTAADISRIDAAWRALWNRPPTEKELQGLVQSHIREVALYRHAVAMGLDRNDTALRRMLGQKLKLLSQNLVELSLSPTDEDLRKFFDGNRERYQPPDLITFTQIYLNPDKRGDETLRDAEAVLEEIRELPDPRSAAGMFGDSLMLQGYLPRKTELDIRNQFGREFAGEVFGLAPGTWQGPVLSGYGVHLVYVHELERTPLPDFDVIREQVKQDWMQKRRGELMDEYVSEVVAGYEVVIDDRPAEEAGPPARSPKPTE